ELHVADAVVDLGEVGPVRAGPQWAGGHIAGQVGARVAGSFHQRVGGLAVGGDGGEDGLAAVVLDRLRGGQAPGAVGGGVGVGRFRRGHLDRQVDHAV